MASEGMNKFIFRVGALGVISIALVAFVPPLVRNSASGSKDIYNLETKCWCPAPFSSSQVDFTNTLCADEVRNNKTRPLPPGALNETKYIAPERHDYTINDIITKKPSAECFTFLVLGIELMLLILFYAVISNRNEYFEDTDDKMKKELLAEGQEVRVRSMSCGHMVVYAVMGVCFIFLAVAPHVVMTQTVGKDTYHSGQGLCSFKIHRLGSVHMYTVQCFYSYEEPSGVNMQRALMMNSGLCAVVVTMLFAQILSSFRSKKN